MAVSFSCPSCGAAIQFKLASSITGVCQYCHSVVVRHDLELKDLGKISFLTPDLSPLQLNTRGQWQKQFFSIIGRVQIRWDAGRWNEWYLFFENGNFGWLAEAQGFYGICLKKMPQEIPSRHEILLKPPVSFGKNSYTVEDMREACVEGLEGELPTTILPGETFLSVDLMGKKNQFASIQYFSSQTECYEGEYLKFADFHFEFLRTLDGW